MDTRQVGRQDCADLGRKVPDGKLMLAETPNPLASRNVLTMGRLAPADTVPMNKARKYNWKRAQSD